MVFRNFTVSLRPGIATFVFIAVSALGLVADSRTTHLQHAGAITADQREARANNFIKERLQFWQKRLNLEKWEVSIQLVRNTSLKPKTLGNIHWDASAMQ